MRSTPPYSPAYEPPPWTSPETRRLWGCSPKFGSPMLPVSGRENSYQPVGCVFRSGTRYWITNVAIVVSAAAAAAGSLFPIQCFNQGMSSVTADAARTPALTFAVGAQLVDAGAGVATVCGSLGVNTGVAIASLQFQQSVGRCPYRFSSHLNDFEKKKPSGRPVKRGCQWT
jgi:hypothetical protein